MRSIHWGRVVLGLVLMCAPAAPGAGAAKALTPVDEAGYRKVLEAHRGKVVLVNFWATWCEPCREEMPHLAALEKKWRARGLVLVTVSADEPEQEADALEFLGRHGVRPPRYIKRASSDERFIESVDARWSGALPALFLYGRDGRKAASFIGETAPADIETALARLL